jgi:glycosyltransferase involved in cell wall biosynthesis
VAARLALGERLPIVVTVHGPLANEVMSTRHGSRAEHAQFYWGIERLAYGGADWLIAVDEGQRAHACNHGASLDRSTVIPNAVDVDAIRAALTHTDYPVPNYRYVFTARRLVPKNGVLWAVRSYIQSQLPRNGVKFIIAGHGPERRHLNSLISDLDPALSQMVVLLGEQPRRVALALAAHADAVLVPSVPDNGVVEATSLALLESLALGAPTIASDIGGLHDVLAGKNAGVLIPPNDEAALIAALEHVCSPRGQCAQFRQRAEALARERYGIGTWAASIVDAYASSLNPL